MKTYAANDIFRMRKNDTKDLLNMEVHIVMKPGWTGHCNTYEGVVETVGLSLNDPDVPVALGLITEVGEAAIIPLLNISEMTVDDEDDFDMTLKEAQ